MARLSLHYKQTEHGQALVEFILVFFLFMMVIFGIFDLGRVFHVIITINNAAREGVRYLTLHPEDNETGFVETTNVAIREAQGSLITLTPSNVVVGSCIDTETIPGCDAGTTVQVTVNYRFRLITGWFLPNPINLSRTVKMMVP